jgi:hypothetical protein
MAKVGSILGWILVVQILYSFGTALVLALRLRNKTHKRYDGLHVYAEFNGAEYHVPREVLELYRHIKDRDIQKATGSPSNPKVFLCWGVALLLPRIIARAIRPFEESA